MDVLNTMDEMRKAYKFDFSESFMSLDNDIVSHNKYLLVIKTIDEQTGTVVTLEKKVEPMKDGI